MVLVMVVHSLETVTATVPMCMIMLKDIHVKKEIPDDFKLRMIVPTSGTSSFSMWDVTEASLLEHWLQANLDQGVKHEIIEVVEDFAFGISSMLSQARAAEKMQEKTRQAMQAAGTQFGKIDDKYSLTEKTGKTLEAAKLKSSAMFYRVATTASKAKMKAMESPAMAQAATSVNQGWQASLKSMEKGFDWAKQKLAKGNSPPPNPAYPPGAPSPVSHPNPMIPVEITGQNPVYAGQNQGAGGAAPASHDQQPAAGQNGAPVARGVSPTAPPVQDPHSVSPDAVFSLDDGEGEDGEGTKQQPST
ncbi:hypothetical protein BSKO_07342 [Bryopsis sp. KO-2023]|nr:hypothetical protein BSKO_07342 [Bryopsis sp. KO-2023]